MGRETAAAMRSALRLSADAGGIGAVAAPCAQIQYLLARLLGKAFFAVQRPVDGAGRNARLGGDFFDGHTVLHDPAPFAARFLQCVGKTF